MFYPARREFDTNESDRRPARVVPPLAGMLTAFDYRIEATFEADTTNTWPENARGHGHTVILFEAE